MERGAGQHFGTILGSFLQLSNKKHENIHPFVCSICFCLLAVFFHLAGDGDGGRGTFFKNTLYIFSIISSTRFDISFFIFKIYIS